MVKKKMLHTGGNSSLIPVNSIIAYYGLNNNTMDITGNGHDGVATDLTYQVGNNYYEGVFNGSSSSIELQPSDVSLGTNPFSLSLVTVFSEIGDCTFLSKWNQYSQEDLDTEYIFDYLNGELRMVLINPDNSAYLMCKTAWTPIVGERYVIAFTFGGGLEPSAGNILIDGVAQPITELNNGYTGMVQTVAVPIIGETPTLDRWMNGSMSSIAVWNKELTQKEVTSITNKLAAGLEIVNPVYPKNNITAYYPLSVNAKEVVGTTLGIDGVGTDIIYEDIGVGNGARFNGAGSSIDISDADIFSFTDGVNDRAGSITFLVKVANYPNPSEYLVTKRTATQSEWQIASNNTPSTNFVMFGENITGNQIDARIFERTALAELMQYSVVYDGSEVFAGLRAGFNNELNSEGREVGTYSGTVNTSANLRLGAPNHGASLGFLDGIIKGLAFWDIELTPYENMAAMEHQMRGLDLVGDFYDNIVAYYNFNENILDATGNGNNGIPINISYVAGMSGEASNYNGSSRVNVSPQSDLSFPDAKPLSLSMYLYWTGTGTSLLWKGGGASDREWRFQYVGDNFMFQAMDPTDNIRQVRSPIDVLPINTWTHVVLTWDGETGQFYVDGSAVETTITDIGTYTGMVATDIQLSIGERADTPSDGNSWRGKIDGLAIWDIELSQEQVTEIYNKQASGQELI